MKTAFISPVASDALIMKRIDNLASAGLEPSILYFERDYYPGRETSYQTRKLGYLAHASLLGRAWAYLKAIRTIRKNTRDVGIVYCFGTDLALLALLARPFSGANRKLVVEVQDIHSLLISDGIGGSLFRTIDNFCIKRADLLVVTSGEYVYSYYFNQVSKASLNFFVQENKVDGSQLERPVRAEKSSRESMVIGYFGLIRCNKSWCFLVNLVNRSNGKIKLYVRGKPLGIASFDKDIESSEFIEYGGPYVSPGELPEIYSKIDVSWIAHAHGVANTKWARSNRFYEALYFGTPMIAQTLTVDSRFVEDQNVGMVLDMHNFEHSAELIQNIDETDLERWKSNIATVPESVFELKDDHRKLLSKILA